MPTSRNDNNAQVQTLAYSRLWPAAVISFWRALLSDRRRAEVILLICDCDETDRILLTDRPAQLLVRRPRRRLALPTGGIQPGETAAHAALREAQEEIGCNVEVLSCPLVIEHRFGVAQRPLFRSYVVHCRCQEEPHTGTWASRTELAAWSRQWLDEREPLLGGLYGRFRGGPMRIIAESLVGRNP